MEVTLDASNVEGSGVWELTILLASNQGRQKLNSKEGSDTGLNTVTDLSRDQTPRHVAGIQFVDVIWKTISLKGKKNNHETSGMSDLKLPTWTLNSYKALATSFSRDENPTKFNSSEFPCGVQAYSRNWKQWLRKQSSCSVVLTSMHTIQIPHWI